MPAATTQFGGDPDVYPDPGVWLDTNPTINPAAPAVAPGPGPTGPPTVHRGPPPWHGGAPPFPAFDWSVGQDIPSSVLDWFRTTVGPLASWYTQNRGQDIGPLQNWAGNPMNALRGANLPQPLMQALFNRGIEEFQRRGIGGPGAWSPQGDAYRLWSQFLGMDHPQLTGTPPNPEIPLQPEPQAPPLTMGRAPGAVPTPPGGGPPGPVPFSGNVPPHWLGPPERIAPGQFDWLLDLLPGRGSPPREFPGGGGPGPISRNY